jgi:hypothetical protein
VSDAEAYLYGPHYRTFEEVWNAVPGHLRERMMNQKPRDPRSEIIERAQRNYRDWLQSQIDAVNNSPSSSDQAGG